MSLGATETGCPFFNYKIKMNSKINLFLYSLVNGFLLCVFGFIIIGTMKGSSLAGLMFLIFIPVAISISRYSRKKLQIQTGKFVNFLLALVVFFLLVGILDALV